MPNRRPVRNRLSEIGIRGLLCLHIDPSFFDLRPCNLIRPCLPSTLASTSLVVGEICEHRFWSSQEVGERVLTVIEISHFSTSISSSEKIGNISLIWHLYHSLVVVSFVVLFYHVWSLRLKNSLFLFGLVDYGLVSWDHLPVYATSRDVYLFLELDNDYAKKICSFMAVWQYSVDWHSCSLCISSYFAVCTTRFW